MTQSSQAETQHTDVPHDEPLIESAARSAGANSLTEVRRIGRNLSYTFLGRFILYGLSAAWVIYLAPALGDEQFGLYSIVRAFVALFALAPDMGIGMVMIRDVAADHARAREYLFAGLLTKIVLAFAAFGLLVALSGLIYPNVPARFFVLAGFGVLAQAVGMAALEGLVAVESMGAAMAVELTSHLTFIAGGFAAMRLGFGLEGVFLAMAASGVVALAVGVPTLAVRFRLRFSDASWSRTRYLLREGFPLGMAAAFGLFYLHADKLILGKMLGEAPTGWYSAAYVLYLTLNEILSTPILVGSYPTLSRYYHGDSAALDKLLSKLVYGMALISLPLAVGGVFTAGPLLDFIYRGAYPESGPVLAVLLWSLVFSFPGAVLAQMLTVEGRQSRVLALRALGAGLMIALNVAMIAWLGYVGPAAAIVLTQAALAALTFWWMRARLPRLGLGTYVIRVVIAQIPLAATCALLRDAHVLVTVGAAAAVYLAALAAVGGIRREDVVLLRAALGR